jgi:hypothetical protein
MPHRTPKQIEAARKRYKKAKASILTPKAITTIGVKTPGKWTEGGKKKAGITWKQYDALKAARKSQEDDKKSRRSPTDAEREAVGEGRAMFNKRGRKALREESIGTKLRSFGRSLKRKVTGRKASRNSGR